MATLILYTNEGERHEQIDSFTTIGRHPNNKIAITDQLVSSEHCIIVFDDLRGYIVKDLKSRNGTYLNQELLTRDQVLKDGDKIVVGRTHCRFKTADEIVNRVRLADSSDEPCIRSSIAPSDSNLFLPEASIKDARHLRVAYERLRQLLILQRDISLTDDIDTTLKRVLDITFKFIKCDRATILLSDRDGQMRPRAYRTKHKDDEMTVSSTMVKHIVEERRGILTFDAAVDGRFKEAQSVRLQGIKSSMAAPILDGEDLLGIFVVDSKAEVNAFQEQDLQMITTIAKQAAGFVQNRIIHDELRQFFDRSVSTLATMVDARHPLTAGHSERVTFYAMLIGRELRLPESTIETLRFAALLHDIGKIVISDKVLLKNGRYSRKELEEMRTHPGKTKSILEKFKFPKALGDVPYLASLHHEKIDGSGYPNGISGDKIPFLSRIIAVADVFDALTSQRDYPKYTTEKEFGDEPMPLESALKIIREGAGTHFDETVVEAFNQCLPQALSRFRGSHFEPSYVDSTIQMILGTQTGAFQANI